MYIQKKKQIALSFGLDLENFHVQFPTSEYEQDTHVDTHKS